MLNSLKQWKKKITFGISLKLFLAFWLVITTSVIISSLATMQFKRTPTQIQVDPEQLTLLSQYNEMLIAKNKIHIKPIQKAFYKKHQQYLIIKKLKTNKVYSSRKKIWSNVREYIKKHSLQNPVTIDFTFTQVTTSHPVLIKNEYYQLFIASKVQRGFIIDLVKQLPFSIRLILILMISFLCCWLLAKSFSSPLIAIKKASEKIGQGELSTRIEKFDQRSDEFGALARSFNNMAEQLENNITAHQRLLGDVSHELRSPLTRLQLAIALAEKNSGNLPEQQKHLTRCETEVDRLDEMISDVLTLSRLEHSHNNFNAEEINLSKLINDLVIDSQYIANNKGIVVKVSAQQGLHCLGDFKMLSSAISNVLNNAVKYSPNDEIISVELIQIKTQIQLSVSDNGSGVPDEMIPNLFQPFFRVADARDRKTGGTGLGLAIAQQAIQLHEGSISAHNTGNKGFTVAILLPVITA